MKLLCKVGLHRWKYTKAHYRDAMSMRLAIPKTEATRECLICGELQVRSVMLLGLNPAEYHREWHKMKKDIK